MLRKHSIPSLAATAVAAAAEAKASSEGWSCVISVVGDAGSPTLLTRMHNAAVPVRVELAPGKAKTAALFRRNSGAFETSINGQRPAAITARGFVLIRGGFPVVINAQVIGTIGVSGDTPDHDEQIAKAGVAAINK
ncbi:GlcG/HbpS family heme-binding protein [Acetobacter fabarum]|uniref:GlcG/HbpS family heme-binding protein n=1 Tax=Acetobacter fabarum TaxID=483199 RepID=UPI0033BE43DF